MTISLHGWPVSAFRLTWINSNVRTAVTLHDYIGVRPKSQ